MQYFVADLSSYRTSAVALIFVTEEGGGRGEGGSKLQEEQKQNAMKQQATAGYRSGSPHSWTKAGSS